MWEKEKFRGFKKVQYIYAMLCSSCSTLFSEPISVIATKLLKVVPHTILHGYTVREDTFSML